jgi:hypothetical protein
MMKSIFILPLLIVLSGCTKTVYVNKVEYLYPEDSWVKPVPYVKPPDRVEFEKAVIEKRMAMFGEAYIGQTANLHRCNVQLEAVKKWKAETYNTK